MFDLFERDIGSYRDFTVLTEKSISFILLRNMGLEKKCLKIIKKSGISINEIRPDFQDLKTAPNSEKIEKSPICEPFLKHTCHKHTSKVVPTTGLLFGNRAPIPSLDQFKSMLKKQATPVSSLPILKFQEQQTKLGQKAPLQEFSLVSPQANVNPKRLQLDQTPKFGGRDLHFNPKVVTPAKKQISPPQIKNSQ